jgi:ATP-binding cassette subfamily F protein 3
MLLNISSLKKAIWKKPLYEDLSLTINDNEKAALIGRNGTGKTSLFKIISGEDKDFVGQVEKAQGIKVIMTQQEHYLPNKISALEYILNDVPLYKELRKTIFERDKNAPVDDAYLNSLQHFTELGYYHIEDNILQSLEDYQINNERAIEDMSVMSGGEKRFVELVRIMYSGADLALIDEPTNHMDYQGKEKFISWLKRAEHACLVITHDRDILNNVDTIYELNDLKVTKFAGNYNAYLKQNSLNNVSAIHKFEVDTKQSGKIKSRIKEIDSLGTVTKRMKIMRERMKRQLAEIEGKIEKPSFWIDQTTLSKTSKKVTEKYNKYKDDTIAIHKTSKISSHNKLLFQTSELVLGYTSPLFHPISLNLYETDRIRLFGRNGAGKTTFIKFLVNSISRLKVKDEYGMQAGPQKSKTKRLPQIVESENDINTSTSLPIKIFSGEIRIANSIKLGIYEQEISGEYLDMTLSKAILKVFNKEGIDLTPNQLMATFDNYLFDTLIHFDAPIKTLSGGEKARFQLIKMLAGNPNLLIMDEPTNHLDLPSIEVLENFIKEYTGAIIYVSHDSYFVDTVAGKEVTFKKV